jgi:hypothetical protein
MPKRAEYRSLNVADAVSRRLRRVNFNGPVQPTPMQETEVFREHEGVKASRIQVREMKLTAVVTG